jgi:hypothetical protein
MERSRLHKPPELSKPYSRAFILESGEGILQNFLDPLTNNVLQLCKGHFFLTLCHEFRNYLNQPVHASDHRLNPL